MGKRRNNPPHGTDIKALQTACGWNSPAMPLRYAEENTIANEGVVLYTPPIYP